MGQDKVAPQFLDEARSCNSSDSTKKIFGVEARIATSPHLAESQLQDTPNKINFVPVQSNARMWVEHIHLEGTSHKHQH